MSDNDPDLQTWIEPGLEARVVAWVLGEASAFEAAELERIIAEKPELEIFKRRIEAVHGLVAAASRLETDPMRLDPERRRTLLEKLGGEKAREPEKVVAMPQEKPDGGRRSPWRLVAGIAACLAVIALLASISVPSFSNVQIRAAATKKLNDERQAELLAKMREEDETPPAASAMPAPASAPHFFGAAPLPSPVERLAALDDLKAMAGASTDEDESAGPVHAGPANAFVGGKELNLARNDETQTSAAESQTAIPQKDAGKAPDRDKFSNLDEWRVTQGLSQTIAKAEAGKGFGLGNGAGPEPASIPAQQPTQTEAVPATPATPAALGGVNTYAGATTISGGALRSTDASGSVTAAGNPPGIGAGGKPEDLANDHTFAFASAATDMPASTGAGVDIEAKFVDKSDLKSDSGSEPELASLNQNPVPILGDIPVLGMAFRKPAMLPPPLEDEVSASDQPYSTFSLHVSDVSFLLARQALMRGQLPDPDSIRTEEFYNAFDYGDPAPATGERIACRIEQAAHPVLQQRNLVRIAMKVAATGRGAGQPLRLTVLLDTSGSMEREDRTASVRRAIQVLASLLGPQDAVTLIGFARQPRLLAEEVPGDQAAKLVDIAAHTPAEGGTNMEEAIKAASELALRHFAQGGQNRVVMLTDGAANLGDSNPAQLSKLVEQLRQKGVSFDACGVGANGLNDDILEALTRKGGGRYYFLNRPEDADDGFAGQLAGAFRPAAENVKMQVRFNPARVGKYRLIGFEKHRLNQEDFRNDKVTAAQLAAEEAAVALYQVQVLPDGDGEIGEVFVRFRDPADGRMIEQSWTIPYDGKAPALDKASPSMQLATTASLVAEKLRGGPLADAVDLDALAPVVAQVRGAFGQQVRVEQLAAMFEQVRRMTGGTEQKGAK